MHTQKNHTVTKFAAFHVVCDTTCTKFCSKRIAFDKVIVKKLQIPIDPNSRTRAWPPSVLILTGLCCEHITES